MPQPIRILIQTTISFTENDWHVGRFSRLTQHLAALPDVEVTARDRAAPPGETDPVLGSLDRSDFDQLWLFAVASGYLLRRGPDIMPLRYAPHKTVITEQRHRKTLMLFIPVSAAMRADPRFVDLCRGCGLVDYWRQSGHWPDFLGTRRIA